MTEREAGWTDIVDLAALAGANPAFSPVWTHQSGDLNVNLLVFEQGDGVAEHVNAEVDVLLVGIAGEGEIAIDGRPQTVRAGMAAVIPKGARRAIRATSDRFAYLTCHRRRAPLLPRAARRSTDAG
ncbi:MAG TPA: cupin domain-containing protein [Thermomicrobiales bacterium]|nr:cupin domain-containing protein [Thermomicrobiales bacterium]